VPRRLEPTIRAASSTLSEEECMRALVVTGVSIALVVRSLSMASAADEKKSTPQQEKMKVCNLRKDQP
jgi:mannose/fructose-specific phosphotransferase system component IIA